MISLSRLFTFCSLGLCLLICFSCKEEQVFADLDNQPVAESYYPLFLGKYITYQVDSILYKEDELTDTVHVLMKETLTDTLRDNEGDLIYRVERAERKNEDFPWEIKHVFTVKRTEADVQRFENSQRFINLTFPITDNTWDGVIFNSDSLVITVRGENLVLYKDWESRYEAIHEPYTIGNTQYDSVLVVSHANSTNAIEQRINREVYAKGIGLIERSMQILDTQSPGFWPDAAEKGFILEQTIIEHN